MKKLLAKFFGIFKKPQYSMDEIIEKPKGIDVDQVLQEHLQSPVDSNNNLIDYKTRKPIPGVSIEQEISRVRKCLNH